MKIFIEDTIKGVHTTEHKSTIYSCYHYFKNLSEHHDSELKLFKSDSKNYITSFSWYDINKWKVDCPVELYEIHRQQYASTEECILLIKKIYQYGDLDNQNNFIDVPIRHFTLDEMIEFQKEDEMMLRGEDPDLYKSYAMPQEVEEEEEEFPGALKGNRIVQKTKKTSIILGNISIPEEEVKTKPISRGTTKKKKKISPLKQFKESTESLKKEKQLPNIPLNSSQPVTNKITKPKNKKNDSDLLNLGKTTQPKKKTKPTLQMGEQLGKKENNTTPVPSKSKNNHNNSGKKKSNTDDSSLLSI